MFFDYRVILACFAVAVAGLCLRFHYANGPLWIDELHTAWVTNATWNDVAPRAAIGNQLPAYFQIVYLTRHGEPAAAVSPFTVRTASLFAGVALVLALGVLTWIWTRNWLALAVCISIAAFDPVFVFYATEARPYVLMKLLGVLQVMAFFFCLGCVTKGQGSGTKFHCSVLLYCCLTAAVVSMHVTGIWICVAQLVWMTLRGHWQKIGLRATAYVIVSALLMCAVVIGDPRELLQRRGNWSSLSSISGLFHAWNSHLILATAGLVAGMGGWLLTRFRSEQAPTQPVTVKPAELRNGENNGETGTSSIAGDSFFGLLLFAACWLLTPLLCVTVLHLTGFPLALSRYTLVGAPALPVICGLAAVAARNQHVQIAASVLLLCIFVYGNNLLVSWYLNAELPALRSENWPAVIEKINADESGGRYPVFLLANLLEDGSAKENLDADFQEYLRFPVSANRLIDTRSREVVVCPTHAESPLSDSDLKLLFNCNGAWVILRARPADVDDFAYQLQTTLDRIVDSDRSLSDKPESDSAGRGQDSSFDVSVDIVDTGQTNDVALLSVVID